MVPVVELPPATPLTDQATAVSVVPVTLAVYCTVVPANAEESVGATVTVAFTAGGVIVTIAEPEGKLSAELMALIVTAAGLGTEAGAVYNPEELTVPTIELPPRMLLTAHVIVVLVVLTTVTENCTWPPAGTDAVTGERVTTGKGISWLLPPELQLVRNIPPAITTRRLASVAAEPFFSLIAPPPGKGS
jgi:hypothetical protein